MANVVISDSHLNNIATAIRYKLDSEATYKPREMAAAIRSIPVATTVVEGDVNAYIDKSFQGEVSLTCKTIGEYSLYYMDGITSIYSNTVETVKERGIYQCNNLTSINLPKVKTLEPAAITACFNVDSISLPSLEVTNSLSISGLFGVKTLQFQVLKYISTGSFESLPELTKADLGGSVEEMEYMCFASCDKLTTIILRCDTPTLVDLDGPFPENFRTDYTGNLSSGYVYVPAAYIEKYKNQKYWSIYNYRAIEDYPGI